MNVQFKGIKGKLIAIILSVTLRMAVRVHSVSQDAQENLQNFFPQVSKKKFVVIPNGIEIDRFIYAKSKKLKEAYSAGNAYLIGFFGRFMGQKGFRYLVDAIDTIIQDDTTLKTPIVLAFGWGGFIEREKRNIKKRRLNKYFKFLPFEPNIAGAIKSLDVVVMPSLWEACGLLAMETLVCGKPLIATNCIGLREVVSNTPTITVPVRDSDKLATAIKSSMEMAPKLELCFKSFVSDASYRFDVRHQSKSLMDLYEQIDLRK